MRQLMVSLIAGLLVLFALSGTAVYAADGTRPKTDVSADRSGQFTNPFEQTTERVELTDPFEPVNRAVFYVNDRLFVYALRPAAKGWSVVPEYGRTRISNLFDNLDDPTSIANSLLQGDPQKAGLTTVRFTVNSTVGIAGLFDPAGYWIQTDDETFDRTFAQWGIAPGPYLMLPLLGPTTAGGRPDSCSIVRFIRSTMPTGRTRAGHWPVR